MVVGAARRDHRLLVKFFVREPPRGHSDRSSGRAAEDVTRMPPTPSSWLPSELRRDLAAVAKSLFGSWPVLNMVLGVTLVSFAGYGVGQFSAPYFIRAFGLDYATVGLIFGLIGGFSSGIGTLAGGFVTDRASQAGAALVRADPGDRPGHRHADLHRSPISSRTGAPPPLILLVPGIFHYTYLGPTFGVVQNVVETRQRATATAVLFLVLNFIALGGGPVFTGWIIDQLRPVRLHPSGGARPWARRSGGLFGGDVRRRRRPGLRAPVPGRRGARPGRRRRPRAACKAALIAATRQGIIVTIFFYAWGALHYLLGAFGLAGKLESVAAQRRAREA